MANIKKTSKIFLFICLCIIFSLCLVFAVRRVSLLRLGASVSDGWNQEGDFWYYYENGTKKTGWLQLNDYKYYLRDNLETKGDIEYPVGSMVTGWKLIDNIWYYFLLSDEDDNPIGSMKTGWLDYDDKRYYLRDNDENFYDTNYPKGSMVTGWYNVSGSWYYFDTNGAMTTDWFKLNDKWYYFDSTGKMATGFRENLTYNGNQGNYYFSENGYDLGEMKTGWQKINGTWYNLTGNGIITTGSNEVYEMEDYAFFDPVTNDPCNETNYWTIYNQDTTCYRFVVLTPDDNPTKETIKLLLDHDIGSSTFNNYSSVLSNETSGWNRFPLAIDLPDENSIKKAMKLSSTPTLDNDSVNGGQQIITLRTNTKYKINDYEYNIYGYWTKSSYDSNYAYTVTEAGNNKLIAKTSTRGVRPMIEIDKRYLTKSSGVIDITNILESSTEYIYEYIHKEDLSGDYNNHNYCQLQGFTNTGSKLVFYTTNNNHDSGNKGLLVYYGDDSNIFNSPRSIVYGDYNNNGMGHGNGMTYNSKTDKVIFLGSRSSNPYIYELSGNTKNRINNDLGYSSIGYDYINNKYFMQLSRRVYLVNTNDYSQKYSFDIPTLLGGQDLEYKNGYIYYVVVDLGQSASQLYSFDEAYSSRIYVYNAKLKSDGTPEKDFGRLDKILYIGNILRTNTGKLNSYQAGKITGTGEIEGISFNNDNVILGFATQNFDTDDTFKFYEFDYSNIKSDIKYEMVYSVSAPNQNATVAVIKANTELSSDNLDEGWTISSDKYTIRKEFPVNTENFSVNICDNYGNCTTINDSFNNSSIITYGWKLSDNNWYYYRDQEEVKNNVTYPVGSMVLGWKKINETWYYLRKFENDISEGKKGAALTGFGKIKNGSDDNYNWYYFNNVGAMQKGLVIDDNNIYYLRPDLETKNNVDYPEGSMVFGWRKIDNKWYYFRKEKNDVLDGKMGAALKGLANIKNSNTGNYNTYYFNNEGIMQEGLVRVNNTYNYFRHENEATYSYPYGSRLENECVLINNNQYCFDTNGNVIGQVVTQITKPTVSGASIFTYNGEIKGLSFNDFDENVMNITGNSHSDAGTYTTTISLVDTNNYQWSDGTSSGLVFTWTITKADINPVVSMEDYYKNATPSIPVITGNLGNGEVTYSYAIKGTDDYTSNPPTKVGEYTVKAVIAATSNYNGATVTSNFKVLNVEPETIVLPDGSIVEDVGVYGALIDSYNREKGTDYDYTHLFTEEELASLQTLSITEEEYHNVSVSNLNDMKFLTSLQNLTIDLWENCSPEVLDLHLNSNLKTLTVKNTTIETINISNLSLDSMDLDIPNDMGYLITNKGHEVSYIKNINDNNQYLITNPISESTATGLLSTNYIINIASESVYEPGYYVVVLGDVKADGIIDIRDVAKAYDGLANHNYTAYTVAEKYALDMNNDNKKSILDLIKIYNAMY